MREQEERIEHLGNTILDEAGKTANQIISEAEARAKDMIQTAYDTYMRDEEEQLKRDKANTRINYQKEVSKRDFDAHKEILAYRSKLINGFFDGIKNKLIEFTKTDAYVDFMMKSIDEANAEKEINENCTVFIGKSDLSLSDKITEKCKAQIKTDKNILLGGINVFYEDDNVYIDKTLDEKFAAEKSGFVNHTELQL